jgi:hypothetical protein
MTYHDIKLALLCKAYGGRIIIAINGTVIAEVLDIKLGDGKAETFLVTPEIAQEIPGVATVYLEFRR